MQGCCVSSKTCVAVAECSFRVTDTLYTRQADHTISCDAASAAQVLDIGDSKQHPDVVLKALYKSLDAAAKDGDQVASHIKK